MRNIINKKLVMLMFLGLSFIVKAQDTPTPPPPGEEGDIGGLSQPIDGYVFWLLIIAVTMIFVAYNKKYKHIKNI